MSDAFPGARSLSGQRAAMDNRMLRTEPRAARQSRGRGTSGPGAVLGLIAGVRDMGWATNHGGSPSSRRIGGCGGSIEGR
jgi:hypothetical protein